MEIRLQKYLSQCGVASRRKAETYILEGRITLNGKVATLLGTKVNVEKDEIMIDGNKVTRSENLVYIMLNKPQGYITSVKDQFNRPTVIDLLKDINERLVPVGRLDYDTSGLLLLTNDGEFTYKLTHPKHNIGKVYIARVEGIPNQQKLNRFMNGLKIDDYTTSKSDIEIVKKYSKNCELKITIYEGKNRQVRKMCSEIGHEVINLKRVQIGNLKLGSLKECQYRHLTGEELKYLQSASSIK